MQTSLIGEPCFKKLMIWEINRNSDQWVYKTKFITSGDYFSMSRHCIIQVSIKLLDALNINYHLPIINYREGFHIDVILLRNASNKWTIQILHHFPFLYSRYFTSIANPRRSTLYYSHLLKGFVLTQNEPLSSIEEVSNQF